MNSSKKINNPEWLTGGEGFLIVPDYNKCNVYAPGGVPIQEIDDPEMGLWRKAVFSSDSPSPLSIGVISVTQVIVELGSSYAEWVIEKTKWQIEGLRWFVDSRPQAEMDQFAVQAQRSAELLDAQLAEVK